MTESLVIDMGDGIVVRHATPSDVEGIVEVTEQIFCHSDDDELSVGIGAWARALSDDTHPVAGAANWTVAEDTAAGRIVSASGYIPQRWTYGCADRGEPVVEFPVGRPEIVATHRDYRARGLVRAQFDLLHRQAERLGAMVLFIDGIHAYYRMYGYEYALERVPWRRGALEAVPGLPEGAAEPFNVREATRDDAVFIQRMYQRAASRSLVACVRDEESLRFHMGNERASYGRRAGIVERPEGEPVGVAWFHTGEVIGVEICELEPGVSWMETLPSVMRWLKRANDGAVCQAYFLQPDHPLFDVAGDTLPERGEQTHPAWYVRVPDVPAFLRLIAPVLEHRLAVSSAAGYTGELPITFYRDGVKLVFEDGRISAVEPRPHTARDNDRCGFVDLTFLQILFGYRTYDELHHMHPDCDTKGGDAKVLIPALFPRCHSAMYPIS